MDLEAFDKLCSGASLFDAVVTKVPAASNIVSYKVKLCELATSYYSDSFKLKTNFRTGSRNQYKWIVVLVANKKPHGYHYEYVCSLYFKLVPSINCATVLVVGSFLVDGVVTEMFESVSLQNHINEFKGVKRTGPLESSGNSIKFSVILKMYDLGSTEEKPVVGDVSSDFTDTLFSKDGDVVLAGSGWEYRAHKAVLVQSSPVFKAMFQHDMEESVTNRVDVADLEADVIRAMLLFIYTGRPHGLERFADKLLSAAHKYQMDRLQTLCEDYFCENISVENAVDLLFTADLYSLDRLARLSLEFIVDHLSILKETDSWQVLQKKSKILFHLFNIISTMN